MNSSIGCLCEYVNKKEQKFFVIILESRLGNVKVIKVKKASKIIQMLIRTKVPIIKTSGRKFWCDEKFIKRVNGYSKISDVLLQFLQAKLNNKLCA